MKFATVDNFFKLKKRLDNVELTDETIFRYAEINGLDKTLINVFIKFELTVSGIFVMDEFNLVGVDVGNKIEELEIERFKNLIKKKYE